MRADDDAGTRGTASHIAQRVANNDYIFVRIEVQGKIEQRMITPWLPEGLAARHQLAQRLLRDDCAGKAGIDDDLRDQLQAIANAPVPASR